MALENSRTAFISLKSELECIELYMSLEQLRFGERLEYGIAVSEGIDEEEVQVPPMILQPYVENAIWHGLLNKEDGTCMLRIVFKENPDDLQEIIAEIEDNGIGRVKSAQLTQIPQ